MQEFPYQSSFDLDLDLDFDLSGVIDLELLFDLLTDGVLLRLTDGDLDLLLRGLGDLLLRGLRLPPLLLRDRLLRRGGDLVRLLLRLRGDGLLRPR